MQQIRRSMVAIAMLLVASQLTQAVQLPEKRPKADTKPKASPISQSDGLVKAVEYLAAKPQYRKGLDRFELHSWKRDKEKGWAYDFTFLPAKPGDSITVYVKLDGTIYGSLGGF